MLVSSTKKFLFVVAASLLVIAGVVFIAQEENEVNTRYQSLPELYVVGDSLAVATDPELRAMAERDGVTYTFVGSSGASIDAGMAAVLEHRPSPNAVIVVSLGTNEPIDNPARFAGFVEYVARFFVRYETFWLNLNSPLCEENNLILAKASSEWEHLHYVDWKAFAEEEGIKTVDQVHYDSDGTRKRAELIYEIFKNEAGI